VTSIIQKFNVTSVTRRDILQNIARKRRQTKLIIIIKI
jgi:hypothetical protein